MRFVEDIVPQHDLTCFPGPTKTVGAALNLIHERAYGVLVVDVDHGPLGIFAERGRHRGVVPC
jgi:hypothetical protein